MRETIERVFYEYLYGDWESLTRWGWLYAHASILLATALVGYTYAHERYVLTLLLVPVPMVYFYKRYEKARTYTVHAETDSHEE
ncbi:hypothetical protein SAMN06269185_2342 [Natronoarchaeum philippinense]|uniref:Uncharacterized protein n=1 Tax=Natronoarchaeum philippinense TaxID=558529 RepID=A0A285P4B3_NATPI|nr:hypothetical protein [Natronoarchaeum philippinense]SNZ14996.1 hypothetical protein SAMN06269185_2342 [Natronoarchaeum philippinense]